MLDLSQLKLNLDNDLEKQIVSSRVLLDKFRLADEQSRKSAPYSDPKFVPFYYYLGKYINPTNMLELGFGIGLFSGCFLKSCQTVKNFLTFQEPSNTYYPSNLAIKNIKDSYKENFDIYIGIYDTKFIDKIGGNKWDLVILSQQSSYDKSLMILESVWGNMELNGLMVVEYVNSHKPCKESLETFCRIKNRNYISFDTRYGTAVVQR